MTHPSKTRKRVVKAWAVINTRGKLHSTEWLTSKPDVFMEEQEAKEMALAHRDKCVPVTISYSLPKSKTKKPKR